MSFFFIQRARKIAKSPKTPKSPIIREQAPMLHRLGCKACPLDKCDAHTPKMAPTYGVGPLMFLAEAPGRDEDENTGRPLTGPSGSLLRGCIADSGGDDHAATYDNVVNCRPEGNRTPTWQEIECCRPRRIKAIERVKPLLIVGLGAVPLTMMLGTSDLAGLRGRLFAVKIGEHACWFMPTYHPAFILRNAKNRQYPLNSMFGHCFRMDIAKACEAVKTLTPPVIENEQSARADIEIFSGDGGFERLMGLMARAKSAKVKSIDLETKGLRPYAEDAAIMSIAISFNANVNFAFAVNHPQALWAVDELDDILGAFADLLKDDTLKIAHNAPFELEWLAWKFGPHIINHCAWECTMMQAHFLDERKGQYRDNDGPSRYQGLDFLIQQHFGLAFKQLFKTNKKDQSKTDLNELLTYNACDTKYTLRLYHKQRLALGTNGDRAAYKLAVLQQPTVALMQHIGVPVHQQAIKEAQSKLGREIEAIEYNIHNMKVVKEFGLDNKGGYNPASQQDTLRIFRDYLKCPEVLVTPTHGDVHDYNKPSKSKRVLEIKPRYSVDKHVLEQIDHPLAKLMLNWRNRTKLKSTYLDGLQIYPDGSLHTNFNTTGTETGRLSSDEPNLQNFPKRNDAWVRSAIIPPRGSVMVAIDYGQLEACTGAMCSKDLYLCKALWDDYDIHMDWARLLDKKMPGLRNGLDMKKFRSLVKNKLVFPAFYGASAKSIAGYLTGAFGCEVTEFFVDDVLDKFWHVLSGMKRWQDKLVKQYYEVGYVTTLGGRKHRYPLNPNQVINHPFQGTAAELVSDAMVRLSYLAAQTGQWFLHPILNIHDDISYFLPKDKLEQSLEVIIKEMLTFDFEWVNVPLSVEVSVGPNWFDMKSLGKFWSHREFGYPSETQTGTKLR